MKRGFVCLLLGALTLVTSMPAVAWEFSMTGEFEHRYRYLSRTGEGDLFGDSRSVQGVKAIDSNRNVNLGLAGPMGGAVIVEGYSAKGSDAAMYESRMLLYPEIRVNNAIRVRGIYSLLQANLNAFGNNNNTALGTAITGFAVAPVHYTGWNFSHRGVEMEEGLSMGVWRGAWVTCQTPWGIIAAGKRPAPFGPGFFSQGSETGADPVALMVPYGPFTFGIGFFLHEAGERQMGGFAAQTPSSFAGSFPYAMPNDSASDPVTVRGPSPVDQNEVRNISTVAFFTYREGDLDVGAMWRYCQYDSIHGAFFAKTPYSVTPNGNFDDATTSFPLAMGLGPSSYHSIGNGTPIYGSQESGNVVTYLQYNNGRLFANLEYDLHIIATRRNGGRPISGTSARWLAEVGWLIGPAKFSAAAFYSAGTDRRQGVYDLDRPTGTTNPYVSGSAAVPFVPVPTYDQYTYFMVLGGGQEAILPYEFLLGIYGGGNNDYTFCGYWRARDLLAYAGRLDYAVAANLNLFGTFMYAERASNTSTYIGQYRGGVANSATGKGGNRTHPGLNAAGLQRAAIPNAPDNGLGWEANIGLNWKLLENFTFNATYGYWKPGNWFKWAYTDFGSNNTATVAGVAYPVDPNRNIDAIHGFQGSLLVNF